jgi:hypothetical protein
MLEWYPKVNYDLHNSYSLPNSTFTITLSTLMKEPAWRWVRDEAPNLKTYDVIMCCLISSAHLREGGHRRVRCKDVLEVRHFPALFTVSAISIFCYR